MSDARDKMNKALKEITVPVLREFGFKGTFPHFHRNRSGHIDLLTFQFRSSGGSFVAELSFADAARTNVYIGKDDPVSKLRTSQTSRRLRLGASSAGSDHWFSYEPDGFFKREANYAGIANGVATLIRSQAEEWWYTQEKQG